MDDHDHIIDSNSDESKLARIFKMSVPQLRAFLPVRFPYEDLKALPFGDAEVVFRQGCCTEDDWQHYCYDFRNDSFKLSDLGAKESLEYAKKNDLPLPLSDRPVDAY